MSPRHRRTEFTAETRREALARSKGICECHRLARAGISGFTVQGCSRPIGPGNIFYEHIITDWHSSDNSLDNCAVLTKTCWTIKTNTHDKRVISKTKRVRDLAFGTKTNSYPPLPGTKRSGWRNKMRGGWERRL